MLKNIMAAGSRDRPPMLATGRYAQWRSRFLRYIDTRPKGDALRKCILDGPYQPTTVTIPAVPATENSPEVPEQTTVETFLTMSPENKDHYESEKEAIHLLLTGIGDEIYSTVNACKTTHEMCQCSISSTTSTRMARFVTIVKQQHKLDEVSYHKFFDILKQYQKEVNKLRAERIAKNANPLALVATAQPHQEPYYQTSKSHKSYAPTSKASLLTRSYSTTRHKGKEIAKPITPPSESPSNEDNDPEQAQKDKEMQKNLALITKYFKKIYKPTNNNLRTSSNTRNKNVNTTLRYKNDNQIGQFGNHRTVSVVGARETVSGQVVQQSRIQCFNCKEFGHFAKECKKPKRVKDSTYHKEKMLLCKHAEKGVQLQAEQSDWLVDTDEEIDEQELEAHYNYMAKIQEVSNANSGTDSESLEQELTECKSILAETSRTLGESNSIQDSCLVALQNKQTEFEREIVNQAWVKHSKDHFRAPTAKDMEILIKTCLMPLALKTQNDSFAFVHELKKEMHADLNFAKLEKHSISLKLALQQCQAQIKNDTVCKEKASNVFLKEREQYFEIQDLKAQLQDKDIAICELIKLIKKCKGKSMETKFDKPYVVRQPNAQTIPKLLVLGKPAPFSDSLERIHFSKTKSIPKTNASEGLSKPVTTHNLPQTSRQAVSNTNVIKPCMYRIDTRKTQSRSPQLSQTSRNTNPRVSTSTRVIHKTNVSRPQLRSTQMKDKVVPNDSQVKDKKTEVENHPRISSIFNKTKSVTASNDNLKSRTLNVDVVCGTYGKRVFNSNHDACVSKYLNDVNARTKKPKVVPISTRKPKSQANKSPIRKQLHQNPLLINLRVTIGCCMRKLVRHRNGG
ncbi:retrovirus-related pol polyprotein from transposon TNT 1-94 [Tanacetum coccineum]